MKPGSPEWHERKRALLATEATQPFGWWYLSYADETRFRGAVIVEARGFASAMQTVTLLGINPGGEVQGWQFDPAKIGALCPDPRTLANRLLSKEELQSMERGVN
jgi:hypothetical protein